MPSLTATPIPNGGVQWFVDFSDGSARLQLFVLLVQCICFTLSVATCFIVYKQFARNHSKFWKASLLGVVLLSPVTLFEVAFTLSQWSKTTLFVFPPLATLAADILVRTGYGLITVCRLWRLKLVSPSNTKQAMFHFRVAALVVVIASVVNLYSSATLRITEYVTGNFGVFGDAVTNTTVIFVRQQDKWLGFITFLIVHVTNFACDVQFVQAIFDSAARTNRKIELSQRERINMLLPYVMPVLSTTIYMLVSVLALVDPSIKNIVFLSISLTRIAPVIETFCFYTWAVHHTRLIIRHMANGGTTGSNSATTGAQSSHFNTAGSKHPSMPGKPSVLNLSQGGRPMSVMDSKHALQGYEIPTSNSYPMSPLGTSPPTPTRPHAPPYGANSVNPHYGR